VVHREPGNSVGEFLELIDHKPRLAGLGGPSTLSATTTSSAAGTYPTRRFGPVPQEDRERGGSWPRWAVEPIAVLDHDPAWAVRGRTEIDLLQQLLRTWLTGDVEHVGSTAVPGLAAKPVVDLQAPVDDLGVADAIAEVTAPHQWHHVPPDLDRRPFRRFFVKAVDDHRVAHLHLLTTGSDRWHQQLAFRDALRADPSLAGAYAELQVRLARGHADDREAYTAGKRQFVHDVLSRHGWPVAD
jgi:GrpB-like predicted nucleotidyltransferase (UPF0157 family)